MLALSEGLTALMKLLWRTVWTGILHDKAASQGTTYDVARGERGRISTICQRRPGIIGQSRKLVDYFCHELHPVSLKHMAPKRH
jgi:hypothetical protein